MSNNQPKKQFGQKHEAQTVSQQQEVNSDTIATPQENRDSISEQATAKQKVRKQSHFYAIRKNGQYAYQLVMQNDDRTQTDIGPENVAAVILSQLEADIMSELHEGL